MLLLLFYLSVVGPVAALWDSYCGGLSTHQFGVHLFLFELAHTMRSRYPCSSLRQLGRRQLQDLGILSTADTIPTLHRV